MTRYRVVAPGGGPSYDWTLDHTFVKISSADTGGAFALMEDNLRRGFTLGLHLHRQHAETFYVLDGEIDFHVDGDWMTVGPATTIHVPPGVPHAVRLAEGRTGKMLMIFQPAGIDRYFAELSTASASDLADERRMEELALRYDIVNLGDLPPGA